MKMPGLYLTRSTIALSIKAFAVLLVTIAIFYQDLAIVANEALKNELMSYILAIPFLLTYLFYRKRKMLRATISFETTNPTRKPTYTREIVGALICLTAFLLYLITNDVKEFSLRHNHQRIRTYRLIPLNAHVWN